jgi:hypothetical protein
LTETGVPFEMILDGLVSDLAKANERVAATRVTADQNASKLADALERIGSLQASHAKELAGLRQQLASAEKQAHGFDYSAQLN